jgi:hypothetical protein
MLQPTLLWISSKTFFFESLPVDAKCQWTLWSTMLVIGPAQHECLWKKKLLSVCVCKKINWKNSQKIANEVRNKRGLWQNAHLGKKKPSLLMLKRTSVT